MNLARTLDDDDGPMVVTVDYRVSPADRASFLEAIEEMGHERQRDGATRWGDFEDVEDDGRYVEIFTVESWLDLRRLRERVTKADRQVERKVEATLSETRTVRFHVAPPNKPRAPIIEAATIEAVMSTLGRRASL
jgi:Transmembrane secretion effector